MLESNSKISVIIPSYNRGQLIIETVESIQAQTYPHWECLIIDDGSTDNTKYIVNELLSKDNRFKYFYVENSGPSKARKFGLTKATGDFIQFIDSDDLISSDRFEKCIKAINNFDFVVTNFDRFKTLEEPFLPPYCTLSQECLNLKSIVLEWDEHFTIPIHCGFFNSEIFNKVTMETSLKMYEDWLMWIDIFLNKFQGKYFDVPLAHYRFSHESLSFQFENRSIIASTAYSLIYDRIPQNLKASFFNVITKRLSRELAAAYVQPNSSTPKESLIFNRLIAKAKRFIKEKK